jgi:hypothetical protein
MKTEALLLSEAPMQGAHARRDGVLAELLLSLRRLKVSSIL